MTSKRLLSLIIFTAFLSISHAQGYISETIQHESLTREYSIYVPASYNGTVAFPLLFNFHGGGDKISNWQTSADMRSIADTANFILVYPQARPDPSNGDCLCWLPKAAGTFDDVPFISDLIDTISNDYEIDQTRIYASGYSLGGEFSYELACKLNEKIAAIGAVARTMQSNPESYCSPVHPTGVLTILGTNDVTSPYDGLIYNGIEYYTSAAETHSFWANHNNCNPTANMNTISSSLERYSWSTTSGCTYVEELKVIGGGHDWPGSFGNMSIDASEEIWQFVSNFNINGIIECKGTGLNINAKMGNKFSVYPNPTKETLTLELSQLSNYNYTIRDQLGKVVKEGNITSQKQDISVSNLSKGIYVISIGEVNQKFIKE